MKIHLEIDANATLSTTARAVLSALIGGDAKVETATASKTPATPAPAKPTDKAAADKAAAAAKVAAAKAAAEAAAAEAEALEKAAAGTESTAMPETTEEGGDEITLEMLQDFATTLLANSERRTFKSILDEVGAKSLSTASSDQYVDLYTKLKEAVDNLASA